MLRRGSLLLLTGFLLYLGANFFLPAQDAGSQPAQPAQQAPAEPPKNDEEAPNTSLFRALFDQINDLINRSDSGMDSKTGDELKKEIREADKIWGELKYQQKRGIREANRQLRANRHECPNIILIEVDELGYGDLGCYGQDKIKTPQFDNLASQSLRCTQYYSGGPGDAQPGRIPLPPPEIKGVNLPHSSAVMPVAFQQPDPNNPAPNNAAPANPLAVFGPGMDVLPRYLWDGGYTTGYCGFGAASFKNQMFDFVYGVEPDDGKISNDSITEAARRFAARNRAVPFYLNVVWSVPKADFQPFLATYPGTNWNAAQLQYAASVSSVDNQMGVLLAGLKELALDQNAVILVTARGAPPVNGVTQFFKSHGPFQAQANGLWEGNLRVPMILFESRSFPKAVYSHPWGRCDLLPTLLDIATVWRRPAGMTGVSQAGIIVGTVPQHNTVIAWVPLRMPVGLAILYQNYKGILAPNVVLRISDLAKDPEEKSDVAATLPEIAQKIQELLRGFQMQ